MCTLDPLQKFKSEFCKRKNDTILTQGMHGVMVGYDVDF